MDEVSPACTIRSLRLLISNSIDVVNFVIKIVETFKTLFANMWKHQTKLRIPKLTHLVVWEKIEEVEAGDDVFQQVYDPVLGSPIHKRILCVIESDDWSKPDEKFDIFLIIVGQHRCTYEKLCGSF
jgi:hypothetical protein